MPDLTPEQVEQLTDAALEDTRRVQRLAEASMWAQTMHRAFKGIRGAPNRKRRAEIAIQAFKLNEDGD